MAMCVFSERKGTVGDRDGPIQIAEYRIDSSEPGQMLGFASARDIGQMRASGLGGLSRPADRRGQCCSGAR